jgi:hypothetical protein
LDEKARIPSLYKHLYLNIKRAQLAFLRKAVRTGNCFSSCVKKKKRRVEKWRMVGSVGLEGLDHVRCTGQYAPTAELSARYHSSLPREGLFTARPAGRSTGQLDLVLEKQARREATKRA